MGGFFGTVSMAECVTDLFYGTDYNSHLGTKRAGMATYDETSGFARSIHSIDNSYFRTKFESELSKFKGKSGIGVISDTDPQPIMINSHLGRFAIVTVAKINNISELEKELLDANMHFAEMSMGKTNPTELVALLIVQGKNFVEGIENVYAKVKGSCSMLLLTEDGIIAARDRLGRTPIIIGKKEGAYAVTSESCSLPNLDFEILIPNRAMLQGKRVLFCDDSIVRGTQLRDNVKILYDYGAKEIHMRIACPPLIYGCPFIAFTSSKSDMELITRRIIEEIEGDGNVPAHPSTMNW